MSATAYTECRLELKSRARRLVITRNVHGFWVGLYRIAKFPNGDQLASAVGDSLRLTVARDHEYNVVCHGAFFAISHAEALKVAAEFGIPLPTSDESVAA
jgi:hypothetical protein